MQLTEQEENYMSRINMVMTERTTRISDKELQIIFGSEEFDSYHERADALSYLVLNHFIHFRNKYGYIDYSLPNLSDLATSVSKSSRTSKLFKRGGTLDYLNLLKPSQRAPVAFEDDVIHTEKVILSNPKQFIPCPMFGWYADGQSEGRGLYYRIPMLQNIAIDMSAYVYCMVHLSSKEYLLYTYIYWKATRLGHMNYSLSYLTKELNLSKKTIAKLLSSLRERNMITLNNVDEAISISQSTIKNNNSYRPNRREEFHEKPQKIAKRALKR